MAVKVLCPDHRTARASLPLLFLFLHWVGEAFLRLAVLFPVESCRLVAFPPIGDSPVLKT